MNVRKRWPGKKFAHHHSPRTTIEARQKYLLQGRHAHYYIFCFHAKKRKHQDMVTIALAFLAYCIINVSP